MMKALLRGLLALPLIGFALSPANATYVGVATGTMWIPGNAVTEDFNSFANGYYLHLDTAVGDMYNVKLSDADVTGVHVLGATGEDGYVYATKNWAIGLTLDAPAAYFGMLWGTVDTYNKIVFFDGLDVVGVFNGDDIVADPDGTGAVYANFYAHGGTFDKVLFFSYGANSFEFDNIAVAPTPLPATLGLFGVAVAALGGLGARRRRKA